MSSSAPPAADRRVQRTRGALRDALIALLPERGWDDIGVQDLCERANIGRSTFYLHFQNKEELLAGSLSDLRTLLQLQANAMHTGKPGQLAFLHGLIDHVCEQRKLFRSLIGRRSGQVVQMRFREMLLQLVEADLAPFAAAGWRHGAALHYLAGALFEMLVWWIEGGRETPSDAIEDYFRQLALPVVTQLANPAV